MIDLIGLKWKENSSGDIYKYEVLELSDRRTTSGNLYLVKCNYWWTNEPENILMTEDEIVNKIQMYIYYNLVHQVRAPSLEEVELLKSLSPKFFDPDNN